MDFIFHCSSFTLFKVLYDEKWIISQPYLRIHLIKLLISAFIQITSCSLFSFCGVFFNFVGVSFSLWGKQIWGVLLYHALSLFILNFLYHFLLMLIYNRSFLKCLTFLCYLFTFRNEAPEILGGLCGCGPCQLGSFTAAWWDRYPNFFLGGGGVISQRHYQCILSLEPFSISPKTFKSPARKHHHWSETVWEAGESVSIHVGLSLSPPFHERPFSLPFCTPGKLSPSTCVQNKPPALNCGWGGELLGALGWGSGPGGTAPRPSICSVCCALALSWSTWCGLEAPTNQGRSPALLEVIVCQGEVIMNAEITMFKGERDDLDENSGAR